jgi:hypothetical protein
MMDRVYYWVGVAVVWGNITVLVILLVLSLLGKRWYDYRWRLGRYWRRNEKIASSPSPQLLKHHWRRKARRSRPAPPTRSEEA